MNPLAPPDDDIHQDEFAARLRQAVSVYGGASALARAIGRSEGAIRKWLRGASEPDVSDLRAISTTTGADVNWLVTGRGDSHLPQSVREAMQLYQSGESTMNYSLLEDIMDCVNEELRRSGVEIPSTKRSTIIVTLYGLFREAQSIDGEAVTRLVRLAA